MTTLFIFGFWLSLTFLVYVYIGFPFIVVAGGKVLNRRVHKKEFFPTVSLIIPAYNEEEVIADRLDNALLLAYPEHALEIIVVSDGSSDKTEEIVTTYASKGVQLLSLPRKGKNQALAAAVSKASGEVLLFSDANIFCEANALKAIAANFADPEVGGVSGDTSYHIKPGSESSSYGEHLYWRYDTWLKRLESQTGSIVSAHGALYAIRRELYQPPADFAAADDFVISTAVIEQGYRLVYETNARAYEEAISEGHREFQRRIRVTMMGVRGLVTRLPLMNPFKFGFYSLSLFSHKVLRRAVVLPLITLLITSFYLGSIHWFYSATAALQLIFYGLACIGYVARAHPAGNARLLYIPYYYCWLNAAALMGMMKFFRGERVAIWLPQRHAEYSLQMKRVK